MGFECAANMEAQKANKNQLETAKLQHEETKELREMVAELTGKIPSDSPEMINKETGERMDFNQVLKNFSDAEIAYEKALKIIDTKLNRRYSIRGIAFLCGILSLFISRAL